MKSSYTKCLNCNTVNLSISILCSVCSKLLIRLRWWFFILLFISFAISSYLSGQLGLIWFEYVYLELLVIGIIFILLRNHTKLWPSLFFFFFLSFILILLHNYYDQFSFLPKVTTSFIKLLIAIYLPIAYWFSFVRACKETEQSIIKSFSVFSLVVFILLNLLKLINKYFLLVDENIISVITKSLYLREIFLIISILFASYISFINALKRRISQPQDLFSKITHVPDFTFNPEVNWISSFLPIIKVIYIVTSKIYIIIITFIKEVINIFKRIMEYLVKFLNNFILEFIQLTNNLIKVFLRSVRFYITLNMIPLFMLFLISIVNVRLSQNIFLFINSSNNISHLFNIMLKIFYIVFLSFFMLWSITEYNFKKFRDSYIFSATFIIFTIFIGSLLSSYALYVFAKFLDNSVFKSFNIFLVTGTILLGIFLVSMFTYSKIKKEKTI